MDNFMLCGMIAVAVFIGASAAAFLSTRDQDLRHAWLDSHGCKRTAYHADSTRGIWSCPDGQVYMLRDVPI